MSEIGLNTILSSSSNVAQAPNAAKVKDAAQQFESMLMEQMLKSARESGSGDWTGTSEDQTGLSMAEMAEQQFAQLLASNGGFGIAKLVVDGLEKKPGR